MEAAGIEPASQYVSTSASTCVVGYLSFAHWTPNRRGFQRASRKRGFSLERVRRDPRRVGIGDWPLGLSDESPRPGPPARQPLQGNLRHLKIVRSAFNVAN